MAERQAGLAVPAWIAVSTGTIPARTPRGHAPGAALAAEQDEDKEEAP